MSLSHQVVVTPDCFLDSTQRPVVAVGVHFFNKDHVADTKVPLWAAPFSPELERPIIVNEGVKVIQGRVFDHVF